MSTPEAAAPDAPANTPTTAPTDPPATGAGHDPCGDRREFQFLVAAALAVCLGLQGFLMWSLLRVQPPDSSWDLIKSLMSHLGQVDVLLIGGLLGMAQQRRG